FERANAEINRVGGVPHEHRGRILGGSAVHRPVLREARQHRGPTPHWLVEHAVDLHHCLEARDAHVELFGAAAVDRAWVLQGQEESEHGRKICVVRSGWYYPEIARLTKRAEAYEPSATTYHAPRTIVRGRL